MTARTPAPKSWSDAPAPAPLPATPPAYTVDHRLAWARLGHLALSPNPPSEAELIREAKAIIRHHALEVARGVVTAAADHLGSHNRKSARDARSWEPTMSANVHAWVSPTVERTFPHGGVVQLLVPGEAWPLLASPGLVRITVEPHSP